MSEVKVNKISPRTNCGTVQLGDSGDTITIPAGATITNNGTQTGFGREGSVDWQTSSIKTATFTATSGEGYFCNTSGGVFTVNLPAGSAGAIVAVADYTRTFNTNNLTITPNGSEKIAGINDSLVLNVNGQALTLVYVDGTEGWINVQNAEDTEEPASFITATGGTITCCGDFKVHTFTGPGTFTVTQIGNGPTNPTGGPSNVDYLVVAGGGGGGSANSGGGGGAGGLRESHLAATSGCYTASPLATPTSLPVSVTGYPITVGGGGPGGAAAANNGTSGNPSTFSTITSTGGGFGGGLESGSNPTGGTGGSGGGALSSNPSPVTGAAGNTPPVSPPQGNNGGPSTANAGRGGGGGGAGSAGTGGGPSGNTPSLGVGGNGVTTSINFSPVTRAGGGGGGTPNPSSITGTAGGSGGGGRGGAGNSGAAGTDNTGSGGGGGGRLAGVTNNAGGNGGSGIVIIRYKFQ